MIFKKFNSRKQFLFMKGITVSTILSFAMATMLIIAVALVIRLMFPYIGVKGGCPAVQRLNIEEIESMAKDAKLTATTYVVKFKVEDCVECMWYYDDTALSQDQIKVRWTGMSTTDDPVIINVNASWGIGDNNGPVNDKTCTDHSISGNTVLLLEVTPDYVNKLS
jgi:hypothetical protein